MQIRPDRETCCGKQVAVHTSLVLAFWRHQLLILASGRPWWSSSKMVRTMDTTLHQWTTSPPEFLQIKGWKVRAFHTHSHQTLIRRLRKSNKNTTFPRGKKKTQSTLKSPRKWRTRTEYHQRAKLKIVQITRSSQTKLHIYRTRDYCNPKRKINPPKTPEIPTPTHGKPMPFEAKKKKKNSDLHQPKPPNRKIPR